MGKRDRRLQHRVNAAAFLEKNTDPVMSLLADVVHDLAEEVDGLKLFDADLALAIELGHRIDNMVAWPDEIMEALDSVIGTFVALIAVSIYRAACRAEKLRGAKIERLKERLEKRGPKMAKLARTRLDRRIKRLEAKQ